MMFYAFPFILALPFTLAKLVQTAAKAESFKSALPWCGVTGVLLCLVYYFAMLGITYTVGSAL